VFHAAGISWTLSTHASEAANFSLFIGNHDNLQKVAERIREAALDLGAKRLVVGECGHAWRVAYSYWNTLIGPFDFLDPRYPAPQHICEVTWDLIQRGALTLDKSANSGKVVTFHDSCNVSRASRMGGVPGGQFTIPRDIIRACVEKFVDMPPETIGASTFCCGGGGGLLTDDLVELRVKGALPRMQALQAVVDEHGVNYLAAICAICKSQFTKVLPYYQHPMDMIGSVHGLVSNAIVLGAKQ
jgi:Fe-S oxidoreductase